MAFTNILPDPNNPITQAGASTGTSPVNGPGYASVSLKSTMPAQTTRTNSGSQLVRNVAAHNWDIGIQYNPLTRAEFEPLYTFLLQKKGTVSHFFVQLPQYNTPQNATWNTYVTSNNMQPKLSSVSSGVDNFIIEDDGANVTYDYTTKGSPSVGDIFSISDSNNTNHKKVYMITRVETSSGVDNTLAAPADNSEVRIHFTPPLHKAITVNTDVDLVFKDVKFRVLNKSKDISYNLDVNNLYKLSLQLEETQP